MCRALPHYKTLFRNEVCIIVASGLVRATAIVLPMEDFWQANRRNVTEFAVLFTQFIFLSYRICSSLILCSLSFSVR